MYGIQCAARSGRCAGILIEDQEMPKKWDPAAAGHSATRHAAQNRGGGEARRSEETQILPYDALTTWVWMKRFPRKAFGKAAPISCM